MAAQQPAIPPPTTTKSYSPPSSGIIGSSDILRRKSANSFPLSGSNMFISEVRKTASHRPSKPVKSWSSILFSPAFSVIIPPFCQCHSAFSVPNVFSNAFPFNNTLKRPGAAVWSHFLTQFRVLTQIRYFPLFLIWNFVEAFFTGIPNPCANK